MERNIEHEVITALAGNGINLTFNTSTDGYVISCVTRPSDPDLMEFYSFPGATIKGALRNMVKDPEFTGLLNGEMFLKLNSDEPEADPQDELIDTLSITNPYLRELRNAFDRALQSAAAAVEDQDMATVTAKIVIVQDEDGPEFANGSKLFRAAKFAVNVGIKRDVTQYKGQTPEFLTKTVDGRMLLIDPDRQITLDEAIRKAEKEVGNAPPEPDVMADVPVDPHAHDADYPEPDADPDEDDEEEET